jgi:hypothetical protein
MSLSPRLDKIESPSTPQTDAIATRLGQKQYLWNVAYNGSITPSISGTNSWSTVRGILVPYQMQDGTWRLKFNIVGNVSGVTAAGSAITGVSIITITGITFASQDQSCCAHGGNSIYAGVARANGGGGTISITVVNPSASSGGITQFSCSGDVELASKPTFAY